MKKIYTAVLRRTSTEGEYAWTESTECERGEEWNGDIVSYLLNAAEDEDEMQEMINRPYTGAIHNLPEDAVILTAENGVPVEIYWSAK
ncbi:MAG: hypothetical protein LUD47_03080 [Clostridia bacterium]|nr:hypothetical protein [Clostridia bacterium]